MVNSILATMENKWVNWINRAILFSFSLLFFLVPLAMHPNTSELFELNKIWIVYGFSLAIAFLWISKIIITRKVELRRTPLDLPIILFLTSQLISTLLSIDRHVSFWGYYSRFNGGLLSTLCYLFLYYAFASNLLHVTNNSTTNKQSKTSYSYKLLVVGLISGTIVALWGLPSHFGYDPTCLVFRGSFDVSCWTEAFQPKVRMFSTLGQPNWLAAYLSILIPISVAFALSSFPVKLQTPSKYQESGIKYHGFRRNFLLSTFYFLLSALFYVDLLFASSQSGFVGFWGGYLVFLLFSVWLFKHQLSSLFSLFKHPSIKILLGITLIFLVASFMIGTPIHTLDAFTFSSIKKSLLESKKENVSENKGNIPPTTQKKQISQGELGGTDSSKIRLIVWRGAVEVFKNNPLFGTGPETFAYAYYKVRPREHNLVSEWEYLYNKAHNEYLNYLATTGGFGLGFYLLLIGWFLFTAVKYVLNSNVEYRNSKQYQNSNDKNPKRFENSDLRHSSLFRISDFGFRILAIALIASYISILISNFFGFSVVIVNLYLFFIPILFYDLAHDTIMTKRISFSLFPYSSQTTTRISPFQTTALFVSFLITIYLEYSLFTFWTADLRYSLGYNLDRVNEYSQAYEPLTAAVQMRPDEDLFKDELSSNLSILVLALSQTQETSRAASLAQEAKSMSDGVVQRHPHNVVYFKTRTRVLYALSQIDPKYLDDAISTLRQASLLAPTDPKILYNLALLYIQKGAADQAIAALKQTIDLKPDYRDPRHSLAILYIQKAKDENNSEKKQQFTKEAISELEYILTHISADDKEVKELLRSLSQT